MYLEFSHHNMEAILSSTKVAAECLGWEDRLGTLEGCKLADLIITRTDPLKDIHSLEKVDNIPLVMLNGKVVKDIR